MSKASSYNRRKAAYAKGFKDGQAAATPAATSVAVKAWTQKDAERENAAFKHSFETQGYPNYPQHYPLITENAMHSAWQEAAERSALTAQAQDMAGWRLVPPEPTREMCEAAPSLPSINAVDDLPLLKAGWSMKAIQNLKRYRAMITAAPTDQEVQ